MTDIEELLGQRGDRRIDLLRAAELIGINPESLRRRRNGPVRYRKGNGYYEFDLSSVLEYASTEPGVTPEVLNRRMRKLRRWEEDRDAERATHYTAPETAVALDISIPTLHRWKREGHLVSTTSKFTPGESLYPRETVDAMAKARAGVRA